MNTTRNITANSHGYQYEARILTAAARTYLEKIVEDRWNKKESKRFTLCPTVLCPSGL